LAFLLGLALLCLSPAAGMAAETTFTVTYKAFDGCPDRAAFIRGVQSRSRLAKPVGAAEQPDIVFAVELKAVSKKKVTGKLLITQGITASDRSVTGVSCLEVSTALALIAALSIDPEAANVVVPEPLPLPPDWSGPPILGSQPALITGPAPVIVPSWMPPLEWRPALIPPPSDLDLIPLPLPVDPFAPAKLPGLEVGFGARMILDVGPAPTPLVGGAAQVELREVGPLTWSIRAELSYTVTAEASASESLPASIRGDYRMLRGRFIGCIPGWSPAPWVRLWPCASVGGGGEWAEYTRAASQVGSAGPWLETGLAGRVELAPLPWLAIEVQAGPALALVRSKFKAGDSLTVFEPSPAGFGLATGVSAAF
jgi:hypothetical protein